MATNRNKRLVHDPVHVEKVTPRGAGHLEMEASDGLVENQQMTEVMPGYHTGTYQAISEGEQSLKASYLGGVKVTTITVKPIPSKLIKAEFTGDEEFVYQNESAEVLLTFDKPLTRGQVPTYRTNPNLMIASKIVIAEDLRSGVFTVMGVNVGEGRVFASLGGVDKDASITVKEAPAILSRILTKPSPVFEGSNVEVRLVHDKTPNKDLIKIDVDPSFTIQGEVAVEGTDAVAVYQTSKFGNYPVEVTSHKITKAAVVNVERVMPKITKVTIPNSVLAGKEFTVEVEFDKNQYLEATDVEVKFDPTAKIDVVEELTVTDNKVIGKYKGTIGYTGNVVVKYLKTTHPETSTITVRAQAKVTTVTFDPNQIVLDGKSVVTVNFDKKFEDDQKPLDVISDSYLNVTKEFTLTGPNNTSGTLEVTGIKEGLGTLTITLGEVTTTHTIGVGSKPPVLKTVQLAKDTIQKGEKTTLICTFSKAEQANTIVIEEPAFVTIDKANPVISDNTITYTVTGKEVNAEGANITVKHTPKDMETITKTALVKVVPDPDYTVTTNPNAIKIDETSVVTMTFTGVTPEKAKVTMTPNDKITLGEITIEGMTAKATITGKVAGEGSITCKYDNKNQKVANITVNPKQ